MNLKKMLSLKPLSKKILEFSNELLVYYKYKNQLNLKINQIEQSYKTERITAVLYKDTLNKILKGRTLEEWNKFYDVQIDKLLKQIKTYASEVYNSLGSLETLSKLDTQPKKVLSKTVSIEESLGELKKTKPIDVSDLKINKEDIKKFIKEQKQKKSKKIELEQAYSVYSSNIYARISNQVTEKLTNYLIKKFPDFFRSLFTALRLADIKLLSRTYVSIMLFSSLIAFPITLVVSYIFISNILRSIGFGFLGLLAVLIIMYVYPYNIIGSRRRKIKNDLVFAIVHMAAISGSGIQPTKIFALLLESQEYKYLETELKKILNYINLFGYSLSTALRTVAATTPSYEFKELLNGIVATIETGGDLKKYLHDKANDSLIAYRMDEKKHLDILSTYSDIYTGVLIAAPLLFLITLAILERISPTLGGMQIGTIAVIGTYIAIPLINIAFILFLNITQPEL